MRPFRQSYANPNRHPTQYYHWMQGTYWTLKPYIDNRPGVYIIDQPTAWQPTTTAIPTKITHERVTIQGTVLGNHNTPLIQPLPPPEPQIIDSQTDLLSSLRPAATWQHNLLHNTKLHLPLSQISQRISLPHQPWIIFTDHHFLNDITSFSWLLFQYDREPLAPGCGPCPGPP